MAEDAFSALYREREIARALAAGCLITFSANLRLQAVPQTIGEKIGARDSQEVEERPSDAMGQEHSRDRSERICLSVW